MTAGERRLAVEVFGTAVELERVRLWAAPWPVARAFVPGRWFGRDWIVWPARRLAQDLSLQSLAAQAVLIHELVHVWQAQQGVNLLWGKLKAGDGPQAYRYPTEGPDCRWDRLNIEQQAMIVEHGFKATQGLPAPCGVDFYRDICPIALFRD